MTDITGSLQQMDSALFGADGLLGLLPKVFQLLDASSLKVSVESCLYT